MLFTGDCSAGPEKQCFDAFSAASPSSTTSEGSCEDYTKNSDVVSYILFSVFGGVMFGVFASVVTIYLYSTMASSSAPLSSKVDSSAFGPMSNM